MQLSAKSLAVFVAIIPVVLASPLGIVWDEKCGCHKTITPTPTPTPTTTPCTTTTSTTPITTPCTTSSTSTYVTPTPSVSAANINTGNQCGQFGTQNNFCFNGGQYSGLSDSCNGGSVYCCQNNPWQNGIFNQNTGNCRSVTVNNYGSGNGNNKGATTTSAPASGGGLLGSLVGPTGVVGQLVNGIL